jgi:hypothetical protein
MQLVQQEQDLYGVAAPETQNMAGPPVPKFVDGTGNVAQVQFLEGRVVVAEEGPGLATLEQVALVEKLDLTVLAAEVREVQNVLAMLPLIRIPVILEDTL